jgi:hypothetical protein
VTAAIASGAIVLAPTVAAESASTLLDPKVATAYVDSQARALCVVQSKAFPTLAALQAAYARAEHSAHLSSHQRAQARAAAVSDVALRIRISERVAATCGKRP